MKGVPEEALKGTLLIKSRRDPGTCRALLDICERSLQIVNSKKKF